VDSLQRSMGAPLPPPSSFYADGWSAPVPGQSSTVSPAMQQVILKAMELDAVKRFPSVRAFKDALNACLLDPALVHRRINRAAPVIPATQVAASNAAFPARQEAGAQPGWTGQPAHPPAQSPALPTLQRPIAPVDVQLNSRRWKSSTFLAAGLVLCLVIGLVGVIGGAALYFGSPTATAVAHADLISPTRMQESPDVSVATRTAQALVVALTKTAESIPTWTDTPPPKIISTPSWTLSPTPPPLPSWTAIPSFTPTAVSNPQATWFPCSGSYPSRLHVGDRAYISYDPPLPNRVRSQPNTSSEILGYLDVGEKMKILEGPVCFGGWVWWRVSSLDKSLTGWTAEGDGTGYWLVPLP
jgi:hypothetical protein